MARIVIIGAGLTGLSVAYHLEKQGYYDYSLFEKESTPGGLCRSTRSEGFTFDYTGHFFHCTNQPMLYELHNIMQQSPMISHIRRSYVYSNSTYTSYPYQTNLYGLPIQTIVDCITGYVQRKKSYKNGYFDAWVTHHFGTGFAQHFFFPYQEKIFDFPVTKLRTGWVQGVPQTNLEDIIQGALQERDVHSIGYNAHFWYPQHGGIDHLVNAFTTTLKTHIITNCSVVAIDQQKKIVTFSNGHKEPYEHLVSTIPLNHTLQLVGIHAPAKKLLCNNVININLGIKLDQISNKHWIYYPEKKYSFFRIGLPYTLGSMAPEGCSSLSIEIATLEQLTPAKINTIKKTAIQQVCSIFKIKTQDIITEQTLILPHAYVIYDTWREKHLDNILNLIAQQSIYSIGRYGAWKYSSMHEAITDGEIMAAQLLSLTANTFKPAQYVQQEDKQIPFNPKQYPSKRPDHV
jgi:protoporphyrinogen oxidase